MKQKLLELLQSTEGFLSGQELSDYLNVSRTAVWKVMKSLEEDGYEIEAVSYTHLYNSGDESVARRDLVISDVDANSAFSYIPYGTSLVDFTAGEPFDAYPKQETDREIFSMYYMNTQRLSNIQKLETAGSYETPVSYTHLKSYFDKWHKCRHGTRYR